MDNTLDIDALASQFEDATPREENDIMVVGVGGGGGNAVNYMFREGVKNVTFVVCNTDKAAVENSPVANKVIIGNGRGAGNKPEVAREFAEADIDKIKKIFDNKARMVFVTAGMGGGTGTGAGPVVARVAKEKGLLTIGIVTIPFVFEGKKKILKALAGADEMAKYVDALLIINNERLIEIYPDLNFFNAFGKADDTVATAARSISEIITIDGYVNLDFNDVDTTLRDGGTAIISTGYGEGEHRVTKALRNALNSPLLKNRDIYGSQRLLINLYVPAEGDGSLAMSEAQELRDFVTSIDDEVDVIWGAAVDNSLGDKVKITVLASGFDVTIRDEEPADDNRNETVSFAAEKAPVKKPKAAVATDTNDRLKQEYGNVIDVLTTSYIILSPDQMDDDTVIDQIERNATFGRDKRLTEALKKGSMPAPIPGTPEPNTPESTTTRICF